MTGENIKSKVEDFIKEKIKVNVKIKFARKLGNGNMILVKIENFKQKISIMENKKILGTKNIYRVSQTIRTPFKC